MARDIENCSNMSIVNPGCVVLVVGLPASGKTTLTSNLVSYLNSLRTATSFQPLRAESISFDDLVPVEEQLKLKKSPVELKKRRQCFLSICESVLLFYTGLNQKIEFPEYLSDNPMRDRLKVSNEKLATSQCFVLLVDDNFYYASMRAEFYQLCRQLSIGFVVIMLDARLEQCISDNRSRPEEIQIPDDLIRRMAVQFEQPRTNLTRKCDRYFALIKRDSNLSVIASLIRKSIADPVVKHQKAYISDEQRDRDREICLKSVCHQMDIFLRLATQFYLSKIDRKRRSTEAKRLSISKKIVLAEIASKGRQIIPDIINRKILDQDAEFDIEDLSIGKDMLLSKLKG